MKKLSFYFIGLAVLCALMGAPSAQAKDLDILGFFFPSLKKKEYDPTETLRAPFAEGAAKAGETEGAEDGGEVYLPENAVPLDRPHRSALHIREWMMPVISEVMTFEDENYQYDLQKTQKYFHTEGRNEYRAFLSQKGFVEALESEALIVRSFVQELPVLLNEGPVGGRYRWLFEVPLMVTIMDRDMKDYKRSDPVTKHFILTVQAGRLAGAENDFEIIIERWAGRETTPVKKKK